MLKMKSAWWLQLIYVLQLVGIFVAERIFSKGVGNIERGLESTLSRSGLPGEQVDAIGLAIYSLGSNVSTFILCLGIVFVATNYVVLRYATKEATDSSQ
jgi:hypothetical protein